MSSPTHLFIHTKQADKSSFEIKIIIRDESNNLVTDATNRIDIAIMGPNRFSKVINIDAIGGIVVLKLKTTQIGRYSVIARSKDLVTARDTLTLKYEESIANKIIKALETADPALDPILNPDPVFYFSKSPPDIIEAGTVFNLQLVVYKEVVLNPDMPLELLIEGSRTVSINIVYPDNSNKILSNNSVDGYVDFYIPFYILGDYVISAVTHNTQKLAMCKFSVITTGSIAVSNGDSEASINSQVGFIGTSQASSDAAGWSREKAVYN